MAWTTTTSFDQILPDQWAAEFVMNLRDAKPLSRLITRDVDMGGVWAMGRVLRIPKPGALTIAQKAVNTAYAESTVTEANVSVTLDQHWHGTILMEDTMEMATVPGVRQFYIEDAAKGIAEKINSTICALYSGLTENTPVGPNDTTGLDSVDLRDAMKGLDNAKVPTTDRLLILHPSDKAALLADTTLGGFFNWSEPETIRSGTPSQLYGWQPVVCPQVVTATGRQNMGIHKRCLIFASRPLPAAGPGAESYIMEDPDTGVVVRVLTQYQGLYGGNQVTIESLWGVAELDGNRGILLRG